MRPIFIHGLLQRTGTNYLTDLLALHPDVAAAPPIWEDHFLEDSHHLARYARALAQRWPARWGVADRVEPLILRALGDGLLALLAERAAPHRVVTKTPSVTHLCRFFDLFPEAHLVLVVRDGRDVVESGHRSFGWDRDATAFRWARAADTVVSFLAGPGRDHPRVQLIRFEALHEDPVAALQDLLPPLELDVARYDFTAARSLAIRGSSESRAESGRVHWTPVERSEDFRPVERWASWSDEQNARFAWLAGSASQALGYPVDPPPRGFGSAMRHRWMDARAGGRYVKDVLEARWSAKRTAR